MKEYTVLPLIFAILTVSLDNKSGVCLLKRREYYLFLAIIFVIKFFVNGYLTGKNIVMYNLKFFLGVRIGSIPVEDFIFGFSMITMTIIFWEYFKTRNQRIKVSNV